MTYARSHHLSGGDGFRRTRRRRLRHECDVDQPVGQSEWGDHRRGEREHVGLIKAWLERVPPPDPNWAEDPDPPRYDE